VFNGPLLDAPRGHQVHVSEYYGRVEMGDPPQAFDVVFDTGSGNIVLPTVKCDDDACHDHRRFASQDSRSAVQLALEDGTPVRPGQGRDTTTITYGTGKLTGEYIRDSVCMGRGDTAAEGVCTTVDFLGVIQESRFPFSELPFDGIFGLGLSGLSAGAGFNFVTRLRTNSTVREPVFAVFLRYLNVNEGSEITFGGYRPERLQDGAAGLQWLPVLREADEKGYWLVTMRDVYVHGKPLGLCDDSSERPRCRVAMDTGSSLMMGPPAQVNKLLDTIGACGKSMPLLTFRFDAEAGGTVDVVLNGEDYAEAFGNNCAFAIQGVDLPPTLGAMWVFGQVALRRYYSVYDAKRWRVGIGLARHSDAPRADHVIAARPPDLGRPAQAEACEDDNKNMAWHHLPGCRSFSAMGYCRRFPPLAQKFCRLSCELCRPKASEPSAFSSVVAPSALQDVDRTAGDGARVEGGGFRLSSERRAVVIGTVREHQQEPARGSWMLG